MRLSVIKKSIVLLLCLVIVGCEEKCEQNFLNAHKNIQQNFKNFYLNPSKTSATNLKNSMNAFLSQHDGVKCDDGSTTLDPSNEIRGILSELNPNKSLYTNDRTKLIAKLIYGDDDRVELVDAKASYQQWGKATLAQIEKDRIGEDGSLTAKTLKDRYRLCDGERFADQLTAARCSGFLVAPDILVTAGHCMEDQFDCDDNVWALDYVAGVNKLSNNKIIGCKRILEQNVDYTSGLDFAVIELDRKVFDRKYLRWRSQSNQINIGQSLVVIGHPSGLPTKVADGANVKENSEEHYFSANLDTFAGNSGSAVINTQSGVVEGILVRGETDYKAITAPNGQRCMVVNQCSDSSGCNGSFEEVSKMSSVIGIPQGYTESGILKGIQDKSTDQVTDLYGIKLYGQQYAEYAIVGRSFLGQCAVSISSDLNNRDGEVMACNQQQSLLNTIASYLNRFYY